MQYDPKTRKFLNGDKYVSHLETREAIDRLTAFIKKESARYAKAFNDGKLSPDEFNFAMRELLKAGHIVSSSVGRGGRERMSAGDWGRVGRKIKWQYGYLDKFTRKLKAGTPINVRSRAAAYVDAIYISYADSFKEAQTENRPTGEVLVQLVQNSEEGCVECAADAALGFIPVSEMGEIGTRICGDWCKCDLEFRDADGNEV